MNTISQSEILLQDATKEVGYFLHRFQVSSVLKRCNGYKQKGFPVIQLFTYLVTLMFQPLSTYMSMRVGAYKEPFSKNTIRRFCNNPSINWHKFLRILSQKLVSEFMRPATSENREEFFIFDDTPFHKSGKKTELVSKYFNHVNMKYEFGYRILTLLWTDGYSNVPVDFAPLSSGNEKLVVSKAKPFDGRTLAGKIRKQACMKAPELILMMLGQAVAAGHKAKYVLFDSWFSTPKGIMDIKRTLGMDVIAMVKKSGKVYYEYNGEQHDVREIFSRCKKRRGRSRYLLSVEINLLQKKGGKILERMPAKLVYVRNKAKKKDWIAIIATDTDLSEEEIIKRYGYRWNIESSFRKLKYTIGLSNFHSYKPELIKQEIWARLIAYNLTETMINWTFIEKAERKHTYKVNFSVAAHICRIFLRLATEENPIDVADLLKRELIPVRKDREYNRLQTAHFRKPRYFIYRAA